MSTAELKRILYVEDEPDIREVAKLALEAVGGFTVEVCSCGDEALRALPRFKPDLVLLDVMMPGMDGPTTLVRLRELPESQGVPAIFMTAKIQPQEIAELRQNGALDVIAKPFDPMVLPQTVRDIWSAHRVQAPVQAKPAPQSAFAEAADGVAQIKRQFIADLPDRIEEVAALTRALFAPEASTEARQTAYRKAHSLNGSAKTFGLPAVSRAARALELQLKSIAAQVEPIGEPQQARIESLLDALLCSAGQQRDVAPAQVRAMPPAPDEIPGEHSKFAYILAEQPDWAEDLHEPLQSYGYDVRMFGGEEELLAACVQRLPAAIVTDVSLSEQRLNGLKAASRLRDTLRMAPPVIFVSDRDDLESRLHAARAGGAAFFTQPVKVSSLVDRLDQLSVRAVQEPYRVMIVEDAEEQAVFCAAVLRQAGMLTCVVSDPRQLLEQLREFHPDLVLMDMYLPNCTGDELARIIRQMDPFVGLPIVFHSVESNFDRQLSAMGLGGDEFLTKPILPAQLVSVVVSRVKHFRTLRALMVQDSLTGLANHSRLQQLLDTEAARSLRQERPLAVAMIDIDHFKLVNDRHGHPTGDRVLQALARFLRQRLRQSDVVARYGGEEFAVVMSNTDGASALMVIERLRSHFATLVHESDKAEAFSVTFSAGIAAMPGHGTARTLLLAADRSLYQAKEGGRNRTVLSSIAAKDPSVAVSQGNTFRPE